MQASASPELYTKADIREGLVQAFNSLDSCVADLSHEQFVRRSTPDKWSAAENFQHLITSGAAVASALKLPKITFLAFGKPNRVSRTYEELVSFYQSKLKEGAKASGKYIPKAIEELPSKDEMQESWQKILGKFDNRLNRWSEKDLDSYFVPHPVLGKLTLREMLFFTIYHTYHHIKAIQKA